jgi:hypothetical protein
LSTSSEPDEFRRPEDFKHTSGPQDSARVLKSTGTRLIKATRPEGQVVTWRVPRKRGC